MAYTVIGMFRDKRNAEAASKKLIAAGFNEGHIDMSPHRAEGNVTDTNRYYDYDEDDHTGGFWDWLFGSDDDHVHNYDRDRYSYAASKSEVITVHAKTKQEAERAAEIMDNAGALDVDDFTRDYTAYQAATAKDAGDTKTLKVLEEKMNVGKRTVDTGGVRVRSRVIEKPVSEKVRLREERVYVRRNPVNRPASEADFDAFREGTISLDEHAEVAVTEKVANVVEEIEVGKDVDTKVETVKDTVRKTEVDVERVAGDVRTTKRDHDKKNRV